MKITYKPAEELIILEMVEYTLNKLAETSALIQDAGRPIVLNWAEGIVFHHMPLPFNTKELLKERQQGRIYWASVIYAPLPEYRQTLKIGPRDIPIVTTPNPLLIQVAKWIKKQMSCQRSHRL
ncbi:MAG TPA: hypothetical protein VM050_02905 [Patescibacteria group bacterium]|nr:hypothetical protein [Patescibacteria group bacterium]